MKNIIVSAIAAVALLAGAVSPALANHDDGYGPGYDGPPPGSGYGPAYDGPPPGSGYGPGYGPPPGPGYGPGYGPPPGYGPGYHRDDRRRCRKDGAAGAVVGGIIGGIIGNNAAHGRDRGPATVVGAIIGGVAGNAIARDGCKRDRRHHYRDGYRY